MYCRALEVYDEHGIPLSKVYKAQHEEGKTAGLSGGLRFPDACLLWLHTDEHGRIE